MNAFVYLLMAAVFAVMSGALVLDQTVLRGAGRPPTPGGPALPAARQGAPVAAPTLALPRLAAQAEGWALMGPSGTLVATNLPERAALLAGACAVLRLAGDSGGGEMPPPWHTVSLEGPRGFLLGEMSPRGAILAVLARVHSNRGDLRQAMAEALVEVERRWDEVLPAVVPGAAGAPGAPWPEALADVLAQARLPAADGPPQPGAGTPETGGIGAFTPLE